MRWLLALLLSGCGPIDMSEPGDGWDDRALPIIQEFTEDVERYEVPLGKLGLVAVIRQNSAKVAEVPPEHPDQILLGYCQIIVAKPGRHWRGEIYLLEGLDDETFRRVIYHELTHCVYETGHFGEDGDIQNAVVNTEIFGWEEARERHFELLKRVLEERGAAFAQKRRN